MNPQYKIPLQNSSPANLAKTINTNLFCRLKIIKNKLHIHTVLQYTLIIFYSDLWSIWAHAQCICEQTIHCGTTAAAISIWTALPFLDSSCYPDWDSSCYLPTYTLTEPKIYDFVNSKRKCFVFSQSPSTPLKGLDLACVDFHLSFEYRTIPVFVNLFLWIQRLNVACMISLWEKISYKSLVY